MHLNKKVRMKELLTLEECEELGFNPESEATILHECYLDKIKYYGVQEKR